MPNVPILYTMAGNSVMKELIPLPPIEGIASRPIILEKRGAHRDLRMGKIKSHYTLLILLINTTRTMKLLTPCLY